MLSAQDVVNSNLSLSDKIRTLAKMGHSRSQIAGLVQRDYAQVRNVLLNDERKRGQRGAPLRPNVAPGASGLAEGARPFEPQRSMLSNVTRLEVGPDGRIILPKMLTSALGVDEGGILIAEVGDSGAVTLISQAEAVRRANAAIQPFLRPGVSLVDEFLAERRAEAERENGDG